MPPIQHKVRTGDTVGSIAERFKVRKEDVSGFRSNDPNVIFPDEVLTITPQVDATQQATPVSGQAPQIQDGALAPTPGVPPAQPQPVGQPQVQPTGQPPVQPTAEAPVAPTPIAPPPPPEPATVAELPTNEESLAQIAQFDPALAESLRSTIGGTFTTPSGLKVNEQGETIGQAVDEPTNQFFGQFDTSTDELAQGFQFNPGATLSALVQQVMEATGLPDIRENLTNIVNGIEDIENKRDSDINAVNDDPFLSASTKATRVQKIRDKAEQRLSNRINKLTLLQSAQKDARDQARFAATTAINLFSSERDFQQAQIEDQLDRAESFLEAERRQEERQFGRNLDLAKLSQAERKLAIQEKGVVDVGGFGNSVLGNAADVLAAKFNTKFQQQAFNSTAQRLAQSGDEQQFADFIFSSAIDQISDSETRKKAFSQYKISQKLTFLQGQLQLYKSMGGDTNIFKGTKEQILNRIGLVQDPQLASLSVAMSDTLDALARDRTGAVISESEEKFYDRLLPSTRKTAELNTAVINGLRGSMLQDLNSVLKFQLTGSGFDSVEPFLSVGSPDIVNANLDDDTLKQEFSNFQQQERQQKNNEGFVNSIKGFLFGK